MATERRVLLRIDGSRSYGRSLLEGVSRYAAIHRRWHFYREIPSYVRTMSRREELEAIQRWRPEGVIAWHSSGVDDLLELGVPMIASPNIVAAQEVKERINAQVHMASDCEMIGEMGADYLLSKGFKSFGFCGFLGRRWSQRRGVAFQRCLLRAGHEAHMFNPPGGKRRKTWEQEIERIAKWIELLPKPVAIMACNDDRGLDVIEACNRLGVYIPEEVSVLGVDNETECELSNPPMSSIALNAVRAGYRAAETLDRLMNGEKPSDEELWIAVKPMYVVTRHSTDVLAMDDRIVAQAVHFIQSSIRRPIQVGDVVRTVGLSRRSLEQRFRKCLGRSVLAEIRRIRVTRITQLLTETQMSVAEIAQFFGYRDGHNIARSFRRETGLSLIEYRRRYGATS